MVVTGSCPNHRKLAELMGINPIHTPFGQFESGAQSLPGVTVELVTGNLCSFVFCCCTVSAGNKQLLPLFNSGPHSSHHSAANRFFKVSASQEKFCHVQGTASASPRPPTQ